MENAVDADVLSHALVSYRMEEHTAVYLPAAFEAEQETARCLLGLLEALPYRSNARLEERIDGWEEQNGKRLNAEQRKAVRAAVCEGVSVITGGPGTGKTTILRCVLSLLDEGDEVALVAPTGRAAKRMAEATGAQAKTIHRCWNMAGTQAALRATPTTPLKPTSSSWTKCRWWIFFSCAACCARCFPARG